MVLSPPALHKDISDVKIAFVAMDFFQIVDLLSKLLLFFSTQVVLTAQYYI